MPALLFTADGTIERTAGAWVPVNLNNGVQIPLAVSLALVSFEVTTLTGGTVTPRIEGSLDGINWDAIDGATIPAQAAVTAAGSTIVGGVGTTQRVDLTHWGYLRIASAEAVGPADGDEIVAHVRATYD